MKKDNKKKWAALALATITALTPLKTASASEVIRWKNIKYDTVHAEIDGNKRNGVEDFSDYLMLLSIVEPDKKKSEGFMKLSLALPQLASKDQKKKNNAIYVVNYYQNLIINHSERVIQNIMKEIEGNDKEYASFYYNAEDVGKNELKFILAIRGSEGKNYKINEVPKKFRKVLETRDQLNKIDFSGKNLYSETEAMLISKLLYDTRDVQTSHYKKFFGQIWHNRTELNNYLGFIYLEEPLKIKLLNIYKENMKKQNVPAKNAYIYKNIIDFVKEFDYMYNEYDSTPYLPDNLGSLKSNHITQIKEDKKHNTNLKETFLTKIKKLPTKIANNSKKITPKAELPTAEKEVQTKKDENQKEIAETKHIPIGTEYLAEIKKYIDSEVIQSVDVVQIEDKNKEDNDRTIS